MSYRAERLVAGGRQVIRYDHRDTGQSDGVDFDAAPYGIADMAADALAVLDGHGIAAAHVVGASMGGVLAQALAVYRPERVRSLVLLMTTRIDGAPGRDLPPPAPAFLASVRAAAGLPRATHDERVAADVVVFEAQSGGVLPYDREAARDLADRYFTRARDWTRAANHQRVGGGGGEPPSPSAITAPTLVLAATADPIFPPGHAEALAAAIPGARLAEVPGMGHTFLSPGLPEHVADLILAHTAG